jgi:hypothetical protein
VDDQPSPGPERSGNDRSYSGLLAALLVTVAVVGAFVGLRAINRDELEVRPEAVDYREAVAAAQDAGITLVYPRQLPEGWIATRLVFERGEHPAWGINLLTADGSFVGLRQEDTPVADLLATYVDEHPSQGDEATLESAVAMSWQAWSDDCGDHAYSAELANGGDTLLVYGSASEAEEVELIGLLVTDPLDGASATS